MKNSPSPYMVENMDDIIDPEFFSAEDRKQIIHSAWAAFLKDKRAKELLPPSEDELRKRYYSLNDSPIGSQKSRSKKQEEYDSKYVGALIRLFKAYEKVDNETSRKSA